MPLFFTLLVFLSYIHVQYCTFTHPYIHEHSPIEMLFLFYMVSCLCLLFRNNLCAQLEFERYHFQGLLVIVSVRFETVLFVSVVSIQVRNTETNRKIFSLVSRNKPKQTRNRSCFGFFRLEPKFFFFHFEDTLIPAVVEKFTEISKKSLNSCHLFAAFGSNQVSIHVQFTTCTVVQISTTPGQGKGQDRELHNVTTMLFHEALNTHVERNTY